MKSKTLLGAASMAVFFSIVAGCDKSPTGTSQPAGLAGGLDRTVLPIQEPAYAPVTELDARKVTPPPRFEVKAPEGAPNVLIVLIDDMGFGMSSAFGGPVAMPNAERLASA